MSLINQMLRDLDRRETAVGPRQPVMPAPVPAAPTTGRRRRRFLFGLLPVLAVLPVAAYYQPQLVRVLPTMSERTANEDSAQSRQQTPEAVQPHAPAAAEEERIDRAVVDSVSQTANTALTPFPQGRLAAAGVVSELDGTPAKSTTGPEETDKHASPDELPEAHGSEGLSRAPGKTEMASGPVVTRVPVRPVKAEETPAPASLDKQPQSMASNIGNEPDMPMAAKAEISRVSVRKVAPERVQESAEDLYATARIHLDAGQLQEAEAALRHSLALDVAQTQARHLLAMLLLTGGERRQAVALLNAGLDIAPGSVSLSTLRARLLMDEGDPAGAVRLLEQPLLLATNDIELMSLLGSAYQQTSRFGDALGIYRRITALQPDNARALAGLAISLDATGNPDQALTVYRQALALDSLPAEVSEYARQRVSTLSVER